MARPIIGITMGDAAGVGPEIIMKAMAVPEVYEMSRPLVIGDARRLRKAGQIVGSKLSVRPIQKPEEAAFRQGEVEVVDLPIIPEDLPFGKLSATAGDAAFKFIQRAVELAMAGRIDAICTAPLNKEALHAGGHKYPGHTELLAKLSGESRRGRPGRLVGPDGVPALRAVLRAGRARRTLVPGGLRPLLSNRASGPGRGRPARAHRRHRAGGRPSARSGVDELLRARSRSSLPHSAGALPRSRRLGEARSHPPTPPQPPRHPSLSQREARNVRGRACPVPRDARSLRRVVGAVSRLPSRCGALASLRISGESTRTQHPRGACSSRARRGHRSRGCWVRVLSPEI